MWFLNDGFVNIHIDGKGSTAKKLAKYKNIAEFQNVFRLLYMEAYFQIPNIEGLPDSIPQRTWKECALWNGGMFEFEYEGGILGLPGIPTGNITLNGDPVAANVYGRNGFTKEVPLYIPGGVDNKTVREATGGMVAPKEGQGVWIKANSLATPIVAYVIEYADKIADTLRTLDTTRANIKRPYVVVAEESIMNTVKAFFNSRDNNEDFIISSGVFPADKIKLLPFDTNAENIRDCTMLIEWYLSQFRQIISVSAPGTVDKKAEVTTAELFSHEGVEQVHAQMIDEILEESIERANKFLGLNQSIKRKEVNEMSKEVNDDVNNNSNEEVQ